MKQSEPSSSSGPREADARPEHSEVPRELSFEAAASRLSDWWWDASTDLVTFTERGARMFGLSVEDRWTWAALRDLIHPEDRERARIAVDEALAAGKDYALEYRVRRPSGVEVWIAARGVGVRDSAGVVQGMVGIVHDVTDRRRTEDLRQRLAAIVESSDDAIVSKSLDGTIQSWNSGAERMFGYTPEEIVGRSVLTLIPTERHREEREILDTLTKGQRVEHYETFRKRKDGTQFPVSLSVSPIFDVDGRIVGASKIARDVSARRRAELKLREESETLNLINETGRAIAADLDQEAIVRKVMDAGRVLTGARFVAFFRHVDDEHEHSHQLYTLTDESREAFTHLRTSTLVGPTIRAELPIRSDDILQDPRFASELSGHALPGEDIPIQSFLSVPVVSRSGGSLGTLLFGHPQLASFTQRSEDLVAGLAAQAAIAIDNARLYERVRRSAEERKSLLEAERAARRDAEHVSLMKDEFLATLSHELRTPLNAIYGWIQVLEAETGASARVQHGIAVIKRNAKTQAQLIEDLLDMSRIISGKVRLEVQKVEPNEVVRSAIESVRHSADAKQLALHVSLDPRIGSAWCDPNRMQQCIWNLLSNAIKFTPKGGSVRVESKRSNHHIELSVTDTGQGIDPEFLPHVFERFRQADASTTRTHGGLGLGLSIVKSLIELHGGTVRATSAGKGHGSTFCLELPLLSTSVGAGQPGSGPGPEEARQLSLQGLTLIVVDDEPDARLFVQRILEASGATVHLAPSGEEGYELVREKHPHMLISDIGMPDEDGYQFIRRVRRLPPEQGGKTPAMALSAFARAEDRTRSLREGYQAHIVKPVDVTELVALVASLASAR